MTDVMNFIKNSPATKTAMMAYVAVQLGQEQNISANDVQNIRALIPQATKAQKKNFWFLAAQYGHTFVLHDLHKAGVKVNVRNSYANTALHFACSYGQKDNVDFLVSIGVHIHTRDKWGNTLLHDAANCNIRSIVEILVIAGVDINATNEDGETALDMAKDNGFFEIVALLEEAMAVQAKA